MSFNLSFVFSLSRAPLLLYIKNSKEIITMFFWSTPETRVTPSLRDKTSTVATEQDPLISIESCLQYNSTGSSGSSQKNITGKFSTSKNKKYCYSAA